MANSLVSTPYQHDVQPGGTPMVPYSGNNQIGAVPVVNPDGTPISGASSPLYAPISAASNGDNTIVAAVGGKKIKVLAGALMASGAVNIKFTDGPGGTGLTGTMNLGANGGFQIPNVPFGNFITSTGNALVLNLSAAVAVGGWIVYTLV